jgi:hypothetical protein
MTDVEFDPLKPPHDPLKKLIDGTLGPLSRLTETIDLTLEQVSQWIAHPYNRRHISNLVTLLDTQTQLIICQHRLIAAVRLADVARSDASPETVRRACSDLLKLRLIDPYKEDKRPERLPPPPPVDEEKILEMMERWGSQTDPAAFPQVGETQPTQGGKHGFPPWITH